jgi:hypothetical protein
MMRQKRAAKNPVVLSSLAIVNNLQLMIVNKPRGIPANNILVIVILMLTTSESVQQNPFPFWELTVANSLLIQEGYIPTREEQFSVFIAIKGTK